MATTDNFDDLIPFRDVPPMVPGHRAGKPIHVATVFRWASVGIGGVVLKSVCVGSTRCTSLRYLREFFDAVTEAKSKGKGSTAAAATNAATARRAKSEKLADAMGL